MAAAGNASQVLATLGAIMLWTAIGAVLMLAAYGAVWAGVRRWMGKVAAPPPETSGGRHERRSAAGKSDVWGHHKERF